MPGAAVLVEVVDIVIAERRGERVVDIRDRHTERLRLFAVDVDIELGHCGAPERLRETELRVLVGAGEKRLRDFGEPLGAAVAAVLDIELEAPRGAQSEDRRGVERQHQRLLDTRRLPEHLADELRSGDFPLVPVRLRDEDRSRVVAEPSAQEVEPGERDHVRVG